MIADDLTAFRIHALIGQGAFGTVYHLTHPHGHTFAIKFIRKSQLLRHRHLDHLRNQVRCHTLMLGYDSFPQFEGIWESNNLVGIMQELIKGPSLPELQCQCELGHGQLRIIMFEAVRAISELHSKDIVHRDIKPENILIDENGRLKIVDFGLAKRLESKTYTVCGTGQYMAPEIFTGHGHSFPVDWWSLGVVLYELVERKELFKGEPMSVVNQIKQFSSKRLKFNCATEEEGDLIRDLLIPDVAKRIGTGKDGKEVMGHYYFGKVVEGEDMLTLRNKVGEVLVQEWEEIEGEIKEEEVMMEIMQKQTSNAEQSILLSV